MKDDAGRIADYLLKRIRFKTTAIATCSNLKVAGKIITAQYYVFEQPSAAEARNVSKPGAEDEVRID